MTLKEMKKKVLGLIEELNPDSELLTDDPDISTKINDVINQVLFELARLKKIPMYVEIAVQAGELLDFETIGDACDHEVYQVATLGGVKYDPKANGKVFKILEGGTAEIDCFVYPERIKDNTAGGYEFELSLDALEIMPYGIAADLLKSDVSAGYGNIYATRYENMIQRLDPRNHINSMSIEGGVDV